MDLSVESILKLDGLKIIKTTEETDAFGHPSMIIECDSSLPKPVCPNCKSPNVYGNGTKAKDVRDLDSMGYHITLRINARKFECQNCGKTFTEPCPLVKPNARLTTRFRNHLAQEALNGTWDELAYKYSVSPPTISEAFNEWAIENEKKHSDCLYAPRVLGIDECHLSPEGKKDGMRGIFVDNETHYLLDITKDRLKPTIVAWLKSLKAPEQLEVVTMDMWDGYRKAVYEVFGDRVKVVVDHYHVIQELMVQMQKARNNVYSHLPAGTLKDHTNNLSLLKSNIENFDDYMKMEANRLFKAVPDIKTVFALKESFRAIYNLTDRKQAEEAFEKWCKQIPDNDDFKPFKSVERTVRNWHKEIFNFFDCGRVSNAATEAINGKIKKNNRKGNGYKFETLRRKCLFGAGDRAYYPVTKVKKEFVVNDTVPNMNGITNSFMDFNAGMRSSEPLYEIKEIKTKEIHFGVSLDWLNEEIESGRFFDKDYVYDDQEE